MDNQQRNEIIRIIWKGKTIDSKYYQYILSEYINGKSLFELSKELRYNISTIRSFIKNNGIEIRNVKQSVAKFQKQVTLNIDEFLEENLVGWILGDGGLRIPKFGINPKFHYTDKKKDHIDYICSILDKYNIHYNVSFSKTNKCYYINSEARPEFHKYYNLFYGYEGLDEHGRKYKILPNVDLTPIKLRNWYIGDGSSSNQGKKGNHRGFIGCKFENPYITNQFRKLFGEDFKLYHLNNNTYQYYFTNNGLKKLLEYIGNCPVESYKYKWIVSDVQRL